MSDIKENSKKDNTDAAGKPMAKLRHWLKTNKKWVTLIIIVLIASGAVTGYAYSKSQDKTTTVSVATPSPSAKPTASPKVFYSPLTGLATDEATAQSPISSVIIENHPDARPQSGLGEAGVVYEALAEGGITRFQAFFLGSNIAAIGPVRSLRTYFVDFALEFNAPVAHAGGNIDALDLVAPLGMKSLNALSSSSSAFYRLSSRYAPHNLYTTSQAMDKLLVQNGYDKPASFAQNKRKADEPTATPAHPNIHIDYSYNGYQVDYRYDQTSNSYNRFLAGAPHIDATTNKQIQVKNIVVEYMPTSYSTTRTGEQTVIMQTVGTGKAVVFRDGNAVNATWKKASHTARTILTDDAGNEIPLNAGNTWYSIVPVGKLVSY